jgi:hypothetical protein
MPVIVESVYMGIQEAIRSLDEVDRWVTFAEGQLTEAGKTGRLLTAQERTAIASIRARWIAYRERVEALMVATMPDPDQ